MSEKKPLKFETVSHAEHVLKPYLITERLERLEEIGFVISDYTQAEIASFIGASRERTCRAINAKRDADEQSAVQP